MRVAGIQATGEHIAKRLGIIVTFMKRVRTPKTLQSSKDPWTADDGRIGVINSKMVMAVKRAAKAALALRICIGGNDDSSNEKLLIDLYAKG